MTLSERCRVRGSLGTLVKSATTIRPKPITSGTPSQSSGCARERCAPAEPFVHVHHQAHGE